MIEIRRAEPHEHETLTAIAHASKRYWGYPEEWIEQWTDQLTFQKETIARRETWCAVLDHKVVGVYALEIDELEAELEDFWVLPGFMGKGVGRSLFAHALEMARSQGSSRLRIESDPNAADFYRKQGAHQTGEVSSAPADRTLPLLYFDL